jgi:Xaa-Pro aminopeptidase
MRYDPISSELFKLNRKRFAQKMVPDAIAIFHSNDLMPRNGDTFYPFRQNSDLFYLSGLDQEETVLVLFPDCIKEGFHELAFIKRSDEKSRLWEGAGYSKEKARQISGIEKIYWLDEMPIILNELILLAKRIYLNTNEHEHFHSDVSSRNIRMAREMMQKYPLHKYHRAQPILKKLAMIKSHYEIELIQKAIHITGSAFQRVLQHLKPGVFEYELEAEITHEFIRRRANGHAYSPIIASGPNNCVLHYSENTRQCREGELVLMDFGAEYANYAADFTRTIPVNGQFSDRQLAVYKAVLSVLRRASQLLVPGTSMEEYHQKVGTFMEEELLALGLISQKDINKQNPSFPAYKKFFMHSISHHLGRDVHDLSSRYAPLLAGMVLTVEPGIYIREENFGVRLENIILITDEGPVDLTADIPIEAEEIESLMNAEVLG